MISIKGTRPTIDDGAGPIRHKRYTAVIDQYNKAFGAGFYVECIALIESLIGDRLESLANQISGGKMSFQTVSRLAEYLLGKNQAMLFDSEFILTLQGVQTWFGKRSFAVHELGKLAPIPNMNETFADSYATLRTIAEDGMILFREVDKHIRKYRRNNP